LKPGLLFGFCVWGKPEIPSDDPDAPNYGCRESPINSHLIAFRIDAVMTLLTGLFWFLDKSKQKKSIFYVASAFIIAAHGALHYFIQSDMIKCYIADSEMPDLLRDFGTVLFALFSFFLSLIILGFAFQLNVKTFGSSILFALIVVSLTMNTPGDLFLPGLFVVVHPISCIAGLFTKSEIFSSTVGWLFVLCTFVGILELSDCTMFLRPIGGHFWYDLTLHSAVLAALPYFTDRPAARMKKD